MQEGRGEAINDRSGEARDERGRAAALRHDEPVPEERLLRAGPLSAILTGAELRGISVQGVEVIRGIAFVVRDRGWGTPVPQLSNLAGRGRTPTASPSPSPPSPPARAASCAGRAGSTARRAGASPIAATARRRPTFRPAGPASSSCIPWRGWWAAPATIEHSDGRLEHDPVPRPRRPDPALPRHPRHHPRAAARRCAPPAGWRATRLGDRGPPQLARRLVQDLLPAAGAALALHDPGRRDDRPDRAADLRAFARELAPRCRSPGPSPS